MEAWGVFFHIVILLGTALLLGSFAERIKQSPIIGYLVAGMLIGPGGFNLIDDTGVVRMLAELGVALLLFTIGLEFSLARIRALGAFSLIGGAAQILCTAGLFFVGAKLMGLSTSTSVVIGAMMAPSSTACVLRILRDRSEMDSVHGRNGLAILLFQDLALIPLVLLVTILGVQTGPKDVLKELLTTGGLFLLFTGILFVLSTYVFPRIVRNPSVVKNRELLILLATFVALGAAFTAHTLHLSPALGAFMAGLMLGGSPFATQLRADVASLRVLFVTLFFVSVGMLGNLGWIGQHWPSVLLLLAIVLFGKALIIAIICKCFRQNWATSVTTGVALAQVGEFAFVLEESAYKYGLLGDDMFYLLASTWLFSMIGTPYLVAAGPHLGKLASRVLGKGQDEKPSNQGDGEHEHLKNHAVVVGYGPAGRGVVQALRKDGLPVLVVDMNPKGVEAARQEGAHAMPGDASSEDLLEHAGLNAARLLVITIPDHRAALAIVHAASAMAPHVPILSRARHSMYASELIEAGSRAALDEEEMMGMELGMKAEEMMAVKAT